MSSQPNETPSTMPLKRPRIRLQTLFDETWIDNRRKRRKTLKGTKLDLDPVTGYLEPFTRKGFTAYQKCTFIERLKICKNYNQICKSIPIDLQAFYDAVALDTKFREEVNKANLIENRSMQLENALVSIKIEEKENILKDLMKKAEGYRLRPPEAEDASYLNKPVS